MKYVLGVDLGTSSVKVLLVNQEGKVSGEATREYPLSHPQAGYSEQNPEDWVTGTVAAVKEVVTTSQVDPASIEGMSFSGQMHGLVLLNEEGNSLRPAILWNDTRTTAQCRQIEEKLGNHLIEIAKNKALEGFTLPKILWVQEHEPEIFAKATTFVLPKDYLRYRLTGALHMDYSDAAGTLLLDVAKKEWSTVICEEFSIPTSLCPPLIESHQYTGNVLSEVAAEMGLTENTKVFAGGADNACGALGAGIVNDEAAMCSIGTSGVFLSYEENGEQDFDGVVHFFNHGKPSSFYTMGVTLAAGHSLNWFKKTFAKEQSFEDLLEEASSVSVGAKGLLFTPYIVGERTPYADALIRGSFIGIDDTHTLPYFTRAVLEGITFSLKDSLELMRTVGKKDIKKIVSIGGGAKSDLWLQMQADIFDATIIKLTSEQGPGLGAAMLAAVGSGWFDTFDTCAQVFVQHEKEYQPNAENVETYQQVYKIYQEVYENTKGLNEKLYAFR